MKLERTKNSVKGITSGIINKVILLLMPFIVRTIFINTLGIEYLGLNSLFTSILNILNLAELGVGSAIVFSMYSAIAKNDEKAICALMNFFKKVYRIIGCIVIGIGILFIPFIKGICNVDIPGDINIYILYFLYLLNTAFSYFLFAYKNCILSALQQNYILNNVDTFIKIVLNIVQAIFLILGKSYYIYVVVIIIATIIENVINAIIVNKKYPNYKAVGEILDSEKKDIYKKVKALFLYKVGGVVLTSIDSVIISAFLGLTMLGKYNNYYYIITTLFGFFQVYTTAMTAGVGNSIISETVEKNKKDFDVLNFIQIWITGWCSICLVCLYQDFIELWIGKEYLFDIGVVICLTIYFYTWKILDIVNLYKEAAGLWEFDKYRPIVASIVNLVINIVLVNFIGIYGIIISTIISIIVVIFPWSTYVLFREYFKKGYKDYIKKNLINFFIFLLIGITTYKICSLVKSVSIIGILFKALICVIIPNFIYIIINLKNKDFKNTIKWINDKLDIISKINKYKKLIYKVFIIFMFFVILLIISIYMRINYLFKDIKGIHFSIDDTIECFEDITKNNYDSIFENKFFNLLRNYHEKYGTNFTLYCYYSNGEKFSLSDCTNKYSHEFEENSDWLKFGFHAYSSTSDYSSDNEKRIKDDYNDVVKELIRITSKENICTVIRLDRFLGTKNNVDMLIE